LSDYPLGSVHRVTRGPIELLLRRKSEDQVEVWPSLCPHEGGLIDEKNLCDGQAVCPWHGLRFGAVLLGNGGRGSWASVAAKPCVPGPAFASARSCSETGDATPGAICR